MRKIFSFGIILLIRFVNALSGICLALEELYVNGKRGFKSL